MQLEHRDVHRQRGLEGALKIRFGPPEPARDELRDDGGAHRVLGAQPCAVAAVLAQHLENRQVRVAVDQRLQRHGGFVDGAAEARRLRVAQDLFDPCHRRAPHPRQQHPRRRRRQRQLVAQLGHVDQRPAFAKRLDLLRRMQHLTARQEQPGVGLVDVERQRLPSRDAVAELREGHVLHDGCDSEPRVTATPGVSACDGPDLSIERD